MLPSSMRKSSSRNERQMNLRLHLNEAQRCTIPVGMLSSLKNHGMPSTVLLRIVGVQYATFKYMNGFAGHFTVYSRILILNPTSFYHLQYGSSRANPPVV